MQFVVYWNSANVYIGRDRIDKYKGKMQVSSSLKVNVNQM